SGPSDCQCITNRDEGSCRGDYPNQYNTNNKADAIAQCKANLPPPPKVDNNCYTYDSKNNKCLGPKACTSGTMSFRECQDKRKKGLGLGGSKTCCKINIEGGCSCLYDQKKCTGLYREYSSKDDCKDARVTPIGDTITTTGGCTSDGRTPPTYVPVRVTGITNQSIAMQHRGILDILRSKVFALSGYGGSGTWETACDVGVEDSACYSYYNYDDERICEDCNESNGDCALCKPNTEKKCQDGQKLCPKLEYGTVDDTLTSDSDCTSSEVLEQIASKQETECKEYWRHTDCAVIYRKDDPGPGYTNVRKECKGSNLEVADPSGNTHLLGNGCIVKVGDKYETAPNMTRTIVSGGCNSCYVEYVSKDNVYCGNAQVNNVFCGNSLTEVGCNNQRAPVIGCGEECKTDECVCASNCEGNGGEKITNQVDDNGAKPACGGLVVKNEQKQFCCNEDCDCNEQESGSSCSKGYNPRVGLNIDEATSTCQHDQQAFLCNDSCSCLALSNLEYDLEGEIVYADSLNEATATCNSSKSEKQFYCYKENCECYDISGVSYYFSQNFSQIANTLVFVSANDEAGAKVICKGNVKTFCCDNLCSCTESSSEEDSCAEKGIPIKAIDSSKARNACRAAKYCVYNGNTGSFMFERYGYSISDKYPCPTNTLPGYGMCYTVKVGECSSSFIAADDPLVECWKSEDGCRNDKTIKTTLSNCSKIGYIDEISCRYRSEEKENLCWDGKKSRFYTPARGIEENNPNKTVYVCFQPKDILKSSYGTPGCTSGGYYDTFTDCIKAKDGKEPLCYKADGTSCKESKNFSDCYDDSGQLKQGAYLESIVCTKNLIDTAPDVSTLGRCEDSVCSCGDGVISKDYCCQTQLFTYDVKDNAPSSDCKVDKKSEENHVAPIGNRKFCSEDECKINKESVVLKALEDKELPTIGYDSDTQKICARKKTGTDEEKTCKLREWSTLEGWINKRNYNICELKNCITSGGTGGGSLPFIPKAYAEGSEESLENHSFISYYPDDGIYQVTDGKGRTASAIGGTGGYVYYEERNGEDGYQSPEDPQNPKDNEDLIVPRSSFVKVEKVASLLDLSLKKGINIISFNLLPSVGGVDSKLTYADFLAIANRKDENVSRIATFKGGQWEGGAVYNFDTKEIKGQKEEVLTMGKGYLVMAEKDTTISVPGYAIQSPIPIAFSSGWNLIGVHGHDTQYTAKSLINSVNSIEGLKANNVTYWPTSKGMYQGFQLSEGQEYGQDFPISKDLGYFVRINEIKKDCKSIWWNPDGEGNGKCN
ncbi:MAG TPA: hypothetical protein VJY47_04015, partial [Candidatus Dojkabacteria bacterium]|nr:hypothetical protein [Candidatus Dojkabacteria bacterium]